MFPNLVSISLGQRLRASFGALLGIVLVAGIGMIDLPYQLPALLIAPFGASSVLLFAVPASPLAQPWSVVGGNTIAAGIGVTCAILLPGIPLAAAVALCATIFALLICRCLHPPSGAVALTAVIGGPTVASLGYSFVIWPVAAGSLLLVAVAIAYNRATGRMYPHTSLPHARPVSAQVGGGLGVTVGDLTKAIQERDEIISVDPMDLEEVLQRAEVLAFGRRSGGIVASAVMAQGVASVSPATSLRVALRMLRSNGVKALPVVNESKEVVGILTQTDLLDKADWGPTANGSGLGWRLRSISNSDRPLRGKVKDVMTTDVNSVLVSTPIARVIQVMSEADHHHLPVVELNGKLAGMVTQSDVVGALFRVNRSDLSEAVLPSDSIAV